MNLNLTMRQFWVWLLYCWKSDGIVRDSDSDNPHDYTGLPALSSQ